MTPCAVCTQEEHNAQVDILQHVNSDQAATIDDLSQQVECLEAHAAVPPAHEEQLRAALARSQQDAAALAAAQQEAEDAQARLVQLTEQLRNLQVCNVAEKVLVKRRASHTAPSNRPISHYLSEINVFQAR